jgi:hypothetical protein
MADVVVDCLGEVDGPQPTCGPAPGFPFWQTAASMLVIWSNGSASD